MATTICLAHRRPRAGWFITVSRAHEHSTEAFVAEAILHDGTPAVLKRPALPRRETHSVRHRLATSLSGGDGNRTHGLFDATEAL